MNGHLTEQDAEMKIVRFVSGGTTYTGSLGREGVARLIEGELFGAMAVTEKHLPIDRLLPPVVPTDILCIGLNYKAHAAETGSDLPQRPMLFVKTSNTLNGPNDDVTLPRNSSMVDWEAELAIVIGRDCKNVSPERALDYVFGYTAANDVSARDWQKDKSLGGGQFARGKSFDGFCPLGPCVVTRDEVADVGKLRVRSWVNDEPMQDATTADLIFSVPEIVASLSETMTLRAGSVILTGTPEGVGAGRTPPVWLKAGDVVTVEVEGIGRLVNRFV